MRVTSRLIGTLFVALVSSAAAQPDRLQFLLTHPSASVLLGLQPLDSGPRGGLLYVPKIYDERHPLPALVLLHPSEGSAADWFGSYRARADKGGFIVIAPECLHRTWGAGPRDYGHDAMVINRALAVAGSRCLIDRTRMAIGGFSDGASYALSLGIANGDLFQSVIAFSPGYFIGQPRRGNPAIFVAHGVNDDILLLEDCSRRFVPALRKAGYIVEYREFYGKHEMPEAVTDQAMAWLGARFASTSH